MHAAALLLALASLPPPHPTCGTRDILPFAPPLVHRPLHGFAVGVKATRDAFGVVNQLAGDNFIVHWGPDGGVDEATAGVLLAALEAAWATEIDVLGHPAPPTTDEFLFNAYVGDTGGGAPDGFGTGGYFNLDDEGFPMLVVAKDSTADTDTIEWVTAHEFYHAVQYGVNTYSYDGAAAWYWEATAEWAAGEVHPANNNHGSFLGPFAMSPQLGVPFFDYADSGAFTEYHQYGAFIFPRFLSEQVADADLVRESWLFSESNNDPMFALKQLLAERGEDIDEAFADFAATNVSWDYDAHLFYSAWVSQWVSYYPDEDHQVAATLALLEDDEPVAAPTETLPRRFGYNWLTFDAPDDGAFELRFAGDASGDAGTPSHFLLRAVVDGAAPQPVAIVDGEARMPLQLTAGAHVTLVVAAVPASAGYEEVFGYRAGIRLATDPEPTPDPSPRADRVDEDSEAAPFGCAASGAADLSLLGLLALLPGRWLRRQRRPSTSRS